MTQPLPNTTGRLSGRAIEQLVEEATRNLLREKKFGQSSGMSLAEWVMRRRPYLSEGVRFDLESHRYLRDVYSDSHPELVIMKSGQGGASEYCISRAIWSCDVRKMNVLYLLPTIGDISDFSQMRIATALEVSPYLTEIVSSEGRRAADRVQLKRIGANWLVMRGAQVKAGKVAGPRAGASRLKSIPADAVFYDEFDEMPASVEALAVKRLGHSQHKEQIWVSTPTYPGLGVDARFQQSDQRHWFLRCEHCGTRQPLTIERVVTEYDDLGRPTDWHGRREDRAYCACEHCGKELNRLAWGEWVAAAPGASIRGYTFNKLATAQNDPLLVVQALQTVDEAKRQEAYNQDLALPYKPAGSGLDATLLDACVRDYSMGPARLEVPVMGVDVGRVLNVVIRGTANDQGETPLRLAIEVAAFSDLARLIKQYRVQRCVIDALPETRAARDLQSLFPAGLVWLAYYDEGDSKAGEAARWNQGYEAGGWRGTVTIDRTRMFDDLVARFMQRQNTLPANARAIPSYYAQLASPVRTIKTTEGSAGGKTVARWVKTGPDHYAHAELYCATAGLRAHRRAGAWGRGDG
jgi:hypothetical protein